MNASPPNSEKPAQTDHGSGSLLHLDLSYRGMFLLILTVLAVWVILKLWAIVIIVATAFIFMTALLPFVEWLVARGVPRVLSVVIVMGSLLVLLAAMAALVVPATVDEIRSVKDNLPEDARKMEDFLDDFGIEVELEERARNINWDRIVSGETAVDYGQRAVTVGFTLMTIFFLTAYLLADTPRMNRFLYQFVPPGREPEVERWLLAVRSAVGGYVRGQLITSAAITVFTFVVLLLVGVPNAIAFAILAGFFDIIPIIGAVVAVFMPALAAFRESPEQAIVVVVALMAYQQFEDRILSPRVYGQTLNLPPVIVLVAVLIGGQLFGIPGVLLALPAAALARVALDYYMERRHAALSTSPVGDEIAAPDTSNPASKEA